MTTKQSDFIELSDRELLTVTKRLSGEERQATAALVRSLMEIDARRLYLSEGCSSLFTWCTQVLRLDEGSAYNRIEVARAARRFPTLIDCLDDGSLTLTAARRLAPHLTPENHLAQIGAARHGSKRDVERLIASISPKPDAPAVIRKVPAARQWAATPPSMCTPRREPETHDRALLESRADRPVVTNLADGSPDRTATSDRSERRPALVPLSPGRFKLQFTISEETNGKLRRAQDLLRHSSPAGDLEAIFDRAVTLLLDDLERRRFASCTTPRGSRSVKPGSRQIPAAVRREVWKRDAGRCAFVGAVGWCIETGLLEFHHIKPFADGGPATVDNLSLRCRRHNAYEATLCFGENDEPRRARSAG